LARFGPANAAGRLGRSAAAPRHVAVSVLALALQRLAAVTSTMTRRVTALFISLTALAVSACSAGGGGGKESAGPKNTDPNNPFKNNDSGMMGGFIPGTSNMTTTPKPTCTSACNDFPAQPILDTGAPPNAADLFGALDPSKFSGSAPCVLEPQLSSGSTPGALFPANWLRPRFRFAATGDLFEIRITSDIEANALVAYTKTQEWTMPVDVWKLAGPNNSGHSLHVTIRAMNSASPGAVSGVQGDIEIAPVNAGGSLVFWTVKDSNVGPDSSKLFGFKVGDEGVEEVLEPKTVAFNAVLNENGQDLRGEYGGGKPGFSPGEVQCVGCHASTPDGAAVVFTDDWPWDKPIASVDTATRGQIPSYVTPGARALLKMPWLGTQSMSQGHWTAGDRRLMASYGKRNQPFDPTNQYNDRLMWIDLETQAQISDAVPDVNSGMRAQARDARNAAITAAKGTAWDTLDMTGENYAAVTPNWSHLGDRALYVSTDQSQDGHPDYKATRADIYTVPYNAGKGGAVTPLAGASDPGALEFYPAYSADDKLVAFTRAPAKDGTNPDGPYYNRHGETYVIPAEGGTATRLVANDAIACAGDDASLGLLNSWPKWSPHAASVDGKTYYFLIFSSARKYPGSFNIPRGMYTPTTLDTRSSQLYMAAIVVDETSHAVTTYPALYLWNQNRVVANAAVTEAQNSNLTPAWDEFIIPNVIVPH
jgi:hypothetical protein